MENNINSSMRKILGVEGDTDYDKLSLDVICEAKERLFLNWYEITLTSINNISGI